MLKVKSLYAEDGISIEFPDLSGCFPCAEKNDTEGALKNALLFEKELIQNLMKYLGISDEYNNG